MELAGAVVVVVVVELAAVVVVLLLVVVVARFAGALVVVDDAVTTGSGVGWVEAVCGTLEEEVLDGGSEDVEEVADEGGEEPVGPERRPSMRSSPRLSGDAVYTGSTGRPATAGFMAAAQMRAGSEPPVTGRPRTSVMGTILSGWPTHTAVERWGTKPTNQASP